MQRLTLKDYVPTNIQMPKIGWDDPDAVEGWCSKCPGMIPLPGRIYGYAGPVCKCNWARNEIKDYLNDGSVEFLKQIN